MLGAIDFDTSKRVIHAALDRGVTFFETADFYGNGPEGKGASERYLGEILGGHRDQVFIATKFGLSLDGSHPFADNSAAYLERALDESLKRLRTDYIDRSEERRVGKECVRTCRSRWSPYHKKNNKIYKLMEK